KVGGLDDPKAGEVLLRLHEGTVGDDRLVIAVVDDGGRVGRPEPAGEDPVTLGLEPVVERVDGGLLGRRLRAGAVVDHGEQVLHVRSPPVAGRPSWAPLTPATNASASIRHRLADLCEEHGGSGEALDLLRMSVGDASIRSCRTRARSCMRTPTPSTRRSSS